MRKIVRFVFFIGYYARSYELCIEMAPVQPGCDRLAGADKKPEPLTRSASRAIIVRRDEHKLLSPIDFACGLNFAIINMLAIV